jgi:hypothetical protein
MTASRERERPEEAYRVNLRFSLPRSLTLPARRHRDYT